MDELVRSDRRITVRMMAEELDLNRESIRTILVEDLQMRKVCAKMVPKLLSDDQKKHRVDVCRDLLKTIEEYPDFLRRVITGDETWVFQYDLETKRQEFAVEVTIITKAEEGANVQISDQGHADRVLRPKGRCSSRVCS